MANTMFIASISCFILSAAFFIIAVFLFFSLQIRDAVEKLRGQSQANWVMKNEPKDMKKQGKKHSQKKKAEEKKSTPVNQETPTDIEEDREEFPTVLDDGEEKQDSLVSAYEEATVTETADVLDYQAGGWKNDSFYDDTEEEQTVTEMGGFLIEESTDIDMEEESLTAVEEKEACEMQEEGTDPPAAEEPKEFIVLDSILYVHTDEDI